MQKAANKDAIAHKALLESIKEHLENGLPVRAMKMSDDQKKEVTAFSPFDHKNQPCTLLTLQKMALRTTHT